MPFANTDTRTESTTIKKTEFLKLAQGQTLIRILEEESAKFYIHYVKGISIECLGEDECPVCLNNRKIYIENPEGFRDIPGYYPKVQRFAVNVLDRTVVKICPECETENKKFGGNFPQFCECGTMLTNVKEAPVNKVRLLAKGVTVFEQFNAFESSVLDETETPLPITSYDIILSVSGTGKSTKTSAIPMVQRRDEISVPKEELFDSSRAVVKLSASEILDLQKGVSLKDIFTVRRGVAQTSVDETKKEVLAKEVSDEVQSLFSDGTGQKPVF